MDLCVELRKLEVIEYTFPFIIDQQSDVELWAETSADVHEPPLPHVEAGGGGGATGVLLTVSDTDLLLDPAELEQVTE